MEAQPDKLFLFWSRSAGSFGKLHRHLNDTGWTVAVVQNAASLSHISTDAGKRCCLAILNPIDDFGHEEQNEIATFLTRGGSALVAVTANSQDESLVSTNINELIGPLYGVEFNDDCVVRPNPYDLYHPKEAMLEEFVANRGLGEMLRRHMERKPSEDYLSRPQGGPVIFGPRIIFAHGCTLKVASGQQARRPIVVMTSSRWAIPGSQPVCTFHRDDETNSNAILLGSAGLMSDDHLDSEDNKSLLCCLLDFLGSTNEKRFPINMSEARTLELAASNMTADLGRLLEQPVGCLRQLEPLPENKFELLELSLFSFDNSKLPLVIEAHRELGVEHRPLGLMRGHIEWPAEFMAQKPQFLLCATNPTGRSEGD